MGTKRQKLPRRGKHRGFVLVIAMILLMGLLGLALVAVQHTRNATSQTKRSYHDTRVFYVAEGGAAQGYAWLASFLATHPNPSPTQLAAVPVPTVAGFTYPDYRIRALPPQTGHVIPSGPFAGMPATIQPYEIVSHARNATGGVDKTVRLTLNQQALSLYEFGIFYDDDLEIFPDFPLDYDGRIHTNGDLFLGSHNTLDITGAVTCAGHVYNTPKDPFERFNGKARIRDRTGHWQDLRYDSRSPDWAEDALADWGGMLLDSAHGVPVLPYPLPAPANSIEIIKRGQPSDSPEMREKRYYYKAGLLILDGVATDSAGNPITLPPNLLLPTPTTAAYVKDWREGCNMEMHTLDIAVLRGSGVMPANGVVYISYSGTEAAVRLTNGAELPAGGLTVATDNPCYVGGHYNTINKQPSAILCDAFNVYSTNWADGNAAKTLNKRGARATTVYTCVVAGNTETTPGHYNGGAENLIRLHEKWVGHELTYRGSLVCIYQSERATGELANASFEEAHRDWGFDPDLLNADFRPDDELAIRTVARGEWRAD